MADEPLRTAWTFICSAQNAGPDKTVRRKCLDDLAEDYRAPVRVPGLRGPSGQRA